MDDWKARFSDKLVPGAELFGRIRRGDRIFVATGCGEPQYLVGALAEHVRAHPKAVVDAEVFHVWSLGVAPYADSRLKRNFRHTSFFIGNSTRDAVNAGLADYTPVFLSRVPHLFDATEASFDVALLQVSPPDEHGHMSLGISVDITKSAAQHAALTIAQVNENMPRVHGDGFLHADEVDILVAHDEPLLELDTGATDEVAERIGRHVAHLVEDGDTLQVGYGSIPDALLASLGGKQDLGIHTELVSDGIVALMEAGNVTNRRKTLDRGKTVAAFCMGHAATYRYLHDNPQFSFRSVEYTNNPLIIAQQRNMVAINSAIAIDLTGQTSAESIGRQFYSGIGGQADFMRAAVLAPGGKTVLTLPATAQGGTVSRIVPFLPEGAGVTLGRGDVHYVVTEFGIAYLQGKSIRERAMDLIRIADPRFQEELLEQAKRANLVFSDQAFIPGKRGTYPAELELTRTTGSGLETLLRPVRFSDEPLLKDFFYSLSDQSLYRRFFYGRYHLPHELLQRFAVIDYSQEMTMLAVVGDSDARQVVGIGQYIIGEEEHSAEVAFVVRDDYQRRGIGRELLQYLTQLGKRNGLLGSPPRCWPKTLPCCTCSRPPGSTSSGAGRVGCTSCACVSSIARREAAVRAALGTSSSAPDQRRLSSALADCCRPVLRSATARSPLGPKHRPDCAIKRPC